MLVIQRKIMKAQAIMHRSVAKVIDVSRSRFKTEEPDNHHNYHDNTTQKTLPLLNSPLMLFAKEIWQNPRAVGAACPSSRHLAKVVARMIPASATEGLIVDLGAGTGVITTALLQQGIAPERIIALERSHQLAEHLKQHFSRLRVIEGDAAHLIDLLGADALRVNTLICGLPFRSLPHRLVHHVVKEIDHLLPKHGLYLQYTYDLMRGRDPYVPHHFRLTASKIVWNNIPPARVNLYRVERFN